MKPCWRWKKSPIPKPTLPSSKLPREVLFSSQFKRDLKKHYIALVSPAWAEVFHCLLNDIALPEKYCDHALRGNLKGIRDCHVKPDLVLFYENPDDKTLLLSRLGTHSELDIA